MVLSYQKSKKQPEKGEIVAGGASVYRFYLLQLFHFFPLKMMMQKKKKKRFTRFG